MAATEIVQRTRAALGQVGVWLQAAVLRSVPVAERPGLLRRVEELGYGSLWIGETPGGGDAFVQLAGVLAATDTLIVGTGIVNVWARPAATTYGSAASLTEAYPGRLVLGLGVGVPAQAAQVGRAYGKPLATMAGYLDDLAATAGNAFLPLVAEPTPTVLAAVGPKMLALARDRADGAHPFNQPVANTAVARDVLGPDRLLIPEQAVSYHPDPAEARARARAYREFTQARARQLGTDPADSPYGRNLRRLGFTATEIDEVSDRVLDATIAHGDADTVADGLRAHLKAGADTVLVHPIENDLAAVVDTLAALAPALR